MRLVGRAGGCGGGRWCSKSVSLRKPHLSLDLGIICGEPGTDGPGRGKPEHEPHATVLGVLEGKQGQIFKEEASSFTGDLSTGTGSGLDGTLDLQIWDSHFDKDTLMPKAFAGVHKGKMTLAKGLWRQCPTQEQLPCGSLLMSRAHHCWKYLLPRTLVHQKCQFPKCADPQVWGSPSLKGNIGLNSYTHTHTHTHTHWVRSSPEGDWRIWVSCGQRQSSRNSCEKSHEAVKG